MPKKGSLKRCPGIPWNSKPTMGRVGDTQEKALSIYPSLRLNVAHGVLRILPGDFETVLSGSIERDRLFHSQSIIEDL